MKSSTEPASSISGIIITFLISEKSKVGQFLLFLGPLLSSMSMRQCLALKYLTVKDENVLAERRTSH